MEVPDWAKLHGSQQRRASEWLDLPNGLPWPLNLARAATGRNGRPFFVSKSVFWFSHVGNPSCRGMCKAPFTWFQLAPLFCSAILVGVQWLVGKHFHHPAVQRRINRLNFWFSHVGNPSCRGMCKAPFTWFQLAPLFCSAILVGVQWLVGKHFHHPAVQRRINRLNFWFSHVGNPSCRGMCKAPFTWFQLAPLFCSAILVGVQWLVGKHFHHPAVQRRINRLNFWFSHVGNPSCRGMCKAPFTWFQLAPLFCSAILVGVQWLVGKHSITQLFKEESTV